MASHPLRTRRTANSFDIEKLIPPQGRRRQRCRFIVNFRSLTSRPFHRNYGRLRPREIESRKAETRRLSDRESNPGIAINVSLNGIGSCVLIHDCPPSPYRILENLDVDISEHLSQASESPHCSVLKRACVYAEARRVRGPRRIERTINWNPLISDQHFRPGVAAPYSAGIHQANSDS